MEQKAFKELDAASQVNSNFKRHEKYTEIAQNEDKLLQDSMDLARVNPNFAKAWDIFHAIETNMTSTDDARTIMARNPDLPMPIQVKVNIQDNDGEILMRLEELKQL